MISKSVQEIEQAVISEIALNVGEFIELFTASRLSSETGVLDAIEEDWTRLQKATEKVYQQMVSELTNSIDERDMIAKKKRSGTTEE
jgi:hypothetical protein